MDGAAWESFFVASAGAAAAATALSFVAFQVAGAKQWRENATLSIIGASNLLEFAIAVLVSLDMLVPVHPLVRQVGLVSLGALGLAAAARYWIHWFQRAGEHERLPRMGAEQARLTWLSVISYGALVVGGIVVPHIGIEVSAAVVAWLLVSGAGEAWMFLDPRRTELVHPTSVEQAT